MEMRKYRAVDSNGREFEVELAKSHGTVPTTSYARAPAGSGYTRAPQKVGQ